MTPDSALHVRRNGKGGPTVAEVTACLVTPGLTDVNFSSPLHTVELDHLHTDEIKDMTRFSVDGEFYYWKNHSELIRVRDGELLAEFIPSWLVVDVNEHKLGRLAVKNVEKPSLDVIVTTAMVVQERADEARKAVRCPQKIIANVRSSLQGFGPWKRACHQRESILF